MAYHLKNIEKGTLGEFSKICEEYQELEDAVFQENKILAICEIADLYGALEAYLAKYNLNMADAKKMADATKQAFMDGSR